MTKSLQLNPKTVAVTGLHRGDSPQPGASVITSLRRRFPDLRIVGLSYDPMESAIYSRGSDRVDAAYLLPYPGAGADALRDRLDTILGQERIDCVIPCLDSEIPNFTAIRPWLLDRGVRSVLPSKRAFERRGKANLYTFCHRLGIPMPATRASQDVQSLQRFAEKIGYPVYVKGRFYDAHLVNSSAALQAAFDEIVEVWGPPVLVQEPVLGEEYDVVGLGDGRGTVTGSCSIRKMLRTSAGKGFAGVVVADPRIDGLVRSIVHSLRWDGPFELEFIKAPGKPHALFEMNPRFPAWVDFPSQISCNLPARLLERMFDLPETPLRACAPGQMFIRHSLDLLGDIADLAKMASVGERIDHPDETRVEA
jgi:carbamoyl-phosphate synthase large subunit